MTPETGPAQRLDQERDRLLRLRQSLAASVTAEQESDMSELTTLDQHPADMGTETFEQSRDRAVLEHVDGELEEVEAARRRLTEGTYGRCEVCGRPIEAERLELMPATRTCAEHAGTRAERGEAGGGRQLRGGTPI